MKKVLLIGALVLLAGAKDWSAQCMGCHNLSYLTKDEIKTKLHQFKNGQGNPMMVNIVQSNKLTDKDIEEIANQLGK